MASLARAALILGLGTAAAVGQTGEPDDSHPAARGAYARRHVLDLGRGEIVVEAPSEARPAVVLETALKMGSMLRRMDPETRNRLASSGLVVVVVPISSRFTDMAETRDLAGRTNPFGQPLDQARGIYRELDLPGGEPPADPAPAAPGRLPVIVIGEEKILRLAPDSGRSGIHHELAHAIHRLAFTQAQRAEWHELYEDARRHGWFARTYAMVSEEEFFAELTEAYFNVAPYFCDREQLAVVDRAALRALEKTYEPTPMP